MCLTDVSVEVPGYGTVVVDIAFGGSFFALVHASQYNMDINSSIHKIKEAAGATTGNYHTQQDVILVDECLHVSTLYFILSFLFCNNLVEQELLILPEHLSSPPVFSGVLELNS